LRIWTHPRATVRQLLGHSPLYVELLLVAGSGVIQSIVQAMSNNVGARLPGFMILLGTLVIGALWGLFQLHVVATPLYYVGKWTGAPARFGDLRTALAWAAIPQVAILPLWVLGTLVFGRFLYVEPELALARMPLAVLVQGLLSLATLLCSGWWLVLQVFTVAEVQRVSAWRALANLIAAVAMVAVLTLVLFVVFVFFHH
jgi:Yip1-like protein